MLIDPRNLQPPTSRQLAWARVERTVQKLAFVLTVASLVEKSYYYAERVRIAQAKRAKARTFGFQPTSVSRRR